MNPCNLGALGCNRNVTHGTLYLNIATSGFCCLLWGAKCIYICTYLFKLKKGPKALAGQLKLSTRSRERASQTG